MTTHKAIREALEAGPVQYACHTDGEVEETCVFDGGEYRVFDCVIAQRLEAKGLCKTDCQEWKPINVTKPTIEVSAANLRALLADLDAKTEALNRIAENAWKPGRGFCHPEGCDSPDIARAALKGTP